MSKSIIIKESISPEELSKRTELAEKILNVLMDSSENLHLQDTTLRSRVKQLSQGYFNKYPRFAFLSSGTGFTSAPGIFSK